MPKLSNQNTELLKSSNQNTKLLKYPIKIQNFPIHPIKIQNLVSKAWQLYLLKTKIICSWERDQTLYSHKMAEYELFTHMPKASNADME